MAERNEVNSGGYVYPQPECETKGEFYTHSSSSEGGITRRDWLAGLAMQGILSNPTYISHNAVNSRFQVDMCYLIADAMIAEGGRDGN